MLAPLKCHVSSHHSLRAISFFNVTSLYLVKVHRLSVPPSTLTGEFDGRRPEELNHLHVIRLLHNGAKRGLHFPR